jgi:uncharacterized LabA/DUF88 family protein
MEERVAIFIDGSNLYHALESNFRRHDLNFTAFADKLRGTRRLFRIYYYNVLQDINQNPDTFRQQQEFLDALRKTHYLEPRLGSTKLSQGIPVEKGIDIMLATDLLYFAWNNAYDTAILVSGDSDFAYALQTVKNADYLQDLWVSKRFGLRRRVLRGKIVPHQTTPAVQVPQNQPSTSIVVARPPAPLQWDEPL